MRYKRKKENKMATVLNLQQHINKKEQQQSSYSIVDMIMNPSYRQKTYKRYSDNYQETEEEKEIFESWNKRRTGKGK